MLRRKIYPMSLAELEALPTRRLLARLKSLWQCESSLSASDRADDEIESNGSIEFKDTDAWKTAYQQVKQILGTREHIAKGDALIDQRRSKPRGRATASARKKAAKKAIDTKK